MNNFGNGRPLSKKKQVQLMIVLTILAWATQTLHHQWGFGAEVDPATPQTKPIEAAPTNAPAGDADDAVAGKETFVPGEARFAAGATLEMRSEATIVGGEIKLKQICRWSDQDKEVFAPISDFTIARIKNGSPFRNVSIVELRSVLHDAGINLANIDIVGASACTISRSDTAYDEKTALTQWIDAKQGAPSAPATQPAAAPVQSNVQPNGWADAAAQGVTVSTAPAAISTAAAIPAAATEEKQYHNLRELITRDLASRTSLPVEQLQMSFRDEDEKVLGLSEPNFHFDLDPLRARNLGNVSWDVTISAGGESHRVTIRAEGRAWQQQLVLTRPVDSRQVIQPTDYVERRTLVETIPNEPLLSRDQLTNEEASESLKPGTVMTARMVDAVPLVKPGQFVTITVKQGSVQIQTVGLAMEAGSFGQTIRVRNEATRDVYQVIMTGPQQATMGGATAGGATAGDASPTPVAAAQ